MTTLARQLRVVDYFTLGWGTMVGVGWLVVMDDWLLRGGVLGGVVGFAIGGALLLPIGYVYGQLVSAMPDASGEVAYTAQVFPRGVSYATGWMMLLAYFIVCPWEAVAIGRIGAYIFPILNSIPLYQIGGRAVFLPRLVVGLALTALLTMLNYRGIRLAASFQNWTAFGTLALFVIFVSFGASRGSAGNLPPLFTHSKFVSIFLVLQIVPYFMTGYESVGKAAEEANPEFGRGGFFIAIAMAIVVGIAFYCTIIAAVAYAAPWRQLIGTNFLTAAAFQRAMDACTSFTINPTWLTTEPIVPPFAGGAGCRRCRLMRTPGNRTNSKSPGFIAVPPIATKIFLLASISLELRCQWPMVTPASLNG